MKTKILTEIGFTEAEVKVYIALLELGSSTAAPILKKTKLQNSVLYRTLHNLIEDGFVNFIKNGKIKSYNASSPNLLLDYHKEKERRLKEILPILKKKQKETKKQEAQVYSGFRGVKAMLYSLIEDAKKGENCYFFGQSANVYHELRVKLYDAYDKYREEKKINVYGIHDLSVKKFVSKDVYSKMKFVSSPIPQTMLIFRDKLALIAWNNLENPIGVLITSKEMSDQYKILFKEIWKTAKR